VVYSTKGDVILGQELVHDESPRVQLLTKRLRSPFKEFERRLHANAESVLSHVPLGLRPAVLESDSQAMPLADESVDLIVTSPPYAANAIDYMRAHKFSLVWLGFPIGELSQKRGEYIGGEATSSFQFEEMPPRASRVVEKIAASDEKKGQILHRYLSEMKRVLREMYRVLKPSKAAVVVVGNSTMRGMDTETPDCICAIGRAIGFDPAIVGVRELDRNRRMLPAGLHRDDSSQIEQRMHEEYVIGLQKP